jgi:hypothetical protein
MRALSPQVVIALCGVKRHLKANSRRSVLSVCRVIDLQIDLINRPVSTLIKYSHRIR